MKTLYIIVFVIAIIIPFLIIMLDSLGMFSVKKWINIYRKIILPIIFILFLIVPFILDVIGVTAIFKSTESLFLLSFSFLVMALFTYLGLIFSTGDKLKDIEEKVNNSITKLNVTHSNVERIHTNLNTHPIFASKDSFKIIIEKLLELKSTKELAMHFALESLEQISTTAFVKIDISFKEYTKKLLDFIERTNNSIIGTYTFRPKKLYDELVAKKNNKLKKDYIRKIKNKEIDSKIRVVVFELEEILKILEDAFYLKDSDGNYLCVDIFNINDTQIKLKKESEDYSKKDLPEIDWFVKQVVGENNIVRWTLTPVFLNFIDLKGKLKDIINPSDNKNIMSDFAIFDKEILITWREDSHEITKNVFQDSKGTLLMNWSVSTDYLSDKINSLSFDGTLQNSECTYITKSFDELLEIINTIDIEISASLNIRADSLQKFKLLFAKLKEKRIEGYKWKNDEYNCVKLD